MTRAVAVAPELTSSLLFPVEIDDCDCDAAPSTSRARGGRSSAAPLEKNTQVARYVASTPEGLKLLDDVRSLKQRGVADAAQLAQQLQALGYRAARMSQHASHSAPGAMRLAHAFVVVHGLRGAQQPLIVEPNFRQLLEIGRVYTTPRYAALLDVVPEELVAPFEHLAELVQLICEEMRYSFEATGNSCPPWRSTASIMSRWASAKSLP